jgi:hypothetical protein
MPKNPFIQSIEDLLEDEINTIDFEKISWKYAANIKRTNEIFDILESLPETAETKTGTIDTHLLLTELQYLNGEFFGIGFDIAVKRGFYLAFKLISYASSMG